MVDQGDSRTAVMVTDWKESARSTLEPAGVRGSGCAVWRRYFDCRGLHVMICAKAPARRKTAISRRLALAALGLVLLLSPRLAAAQAAPPVTVFAAASLKNAMDDVGKAFTDKTGASVRFSYAASSAIARQIEAGAPADVFISADSDWMDYLSQRPIRS